MQNLLMVFFASTLLFCSAAWAGTIYKCKNSQGALLYQEQPCTEAAESVSSWNAVSETNSGGDGISGGILVLRQGNHGHFFVDGAINDQYLNFIIDTGATVVTLPQSAASTAGLRCISQTAMRTGNGITSVCTTRIQKLSFGNFILKDVDALIAPNLSQPLLGMNVLKRFRVEQESGEMRLSKKY